MKFDRVNAYFKHFTTGYQIKLFQAITLFFVFPSCFWRGWLWLRSKILVKNRCLFFWEFVSHLGNFWFFKVFEKFGNFCLVMTKKKKSSGIAAKFDWSERVRRNSFSISESIKTLIEIESEHKYDLGNVKSFVDWRDLFHRFLNLLQTSLVYHERLGVLSWNQFFFWT